MNPITVNPFDESVELEGPKAATVASDIDGLLRIAATIRHRFGNTDVAYWIQWGDTALFAHAEHQRRIKTLERALSFASSAIKSGEPWTDECEKIISGALQAEPSIQVSK